MYEFALSISWQLDLAEHGSVISSIGASRTNTPPTESNPRRTSARACRRRELAGTPPRSAAGPGGCERTSTCHPGSGSMQSTSTRAYAWIRGSHPRDPTSGWRSEPRTHDRIRGTSARRMAGRRRPGTRLARAPAAWRRFRPRRVAVRGTSRRSAISPNEVAGAELAARRAVHGHLEAARLDHVEAVAVIALADHLGARRRRRPARAPTASRSSGERRQRREDRDRAAAAEVDGASDSASIRTSFRQVSAARTGRNAPVTTNAQRIPTRSISSGVSAAPSPIVPTSIISSTPNTRPITSGGAVRWSSVRPATSTSVFPSPSTPSADERDRRCWARSRSRRAAPPRARSRARNRRRAACGRSARRRRARPTRPPMPDRRVQQTDRRVPSIQEVERRDDD